MERGEQPYLEVGETNKGINRRYCLVTVLLYFYRRDVSGRAPCCAALPVPANHLTYSKSYGRS